MTAPGGGGPPRRAREERGRLSPEERGRLSPEERGRLSPDQPVWEVDGEQRGAEEGPEARQQREPVPESLRRARLAVGVAPQAEALPAGVSPAPSRRRGRGSGRSRRVVATALALGLFAAGTAVGSMLAAGAREPARPARAVRASHAPTTALPTTTTTTTTRAPQVTPRACLSAVDDADVVISYLVTNVNDQRLPRAMQQYQAARSECRRAR
jgi:hypothetical protein